MDDENSNLVMSDDQPMPEAPEQSTLRSEIRAVIEKRIDQLPDVFRTVFVLRALEEMSVEDAATSLNIPQATVRTRYFRARSMLRETLARDIDMATDDAFSFDGERCDRIVSSVLARMPDP
jgi:RNA polymerase sigma-70 factor (ECF subfamily)